MLTQKDIEAWKLAKATSDRLENAILDRITEIIKLLCKAFGAKLDHWYFDDAPEGGVGTLDLDYEFISYTASYTTSAGDAKLAKYGYHNEFPTAFLTMSDTDIVDCVNNDIIRQTEATKKLVKKSKTTIKKAKERAKVLAKLTAEEKRLIGIKE